MSLQEFDGIDPLPVHEHFVSHDMQINNINSPSEVDVDIDSEIEDMNTARPLI